MVNIRKDITKNKEVYAHVSKDGYEIKVNRMIRWGNASPYFYIFIQMPSTDIPIDNFPRLMEVLEAAQKLAKELAAEVEGIDTVEYITSQPPEKPL